MSITTISVCICTYKRKSLLATLQSLDAQIISSDIKIEVSIVDNDSKGSSLSIVDMFKKTSDLDVLYKVEPRQGLSFARNAAVEQATGSLLAFIDDDEVAHPNWLALLYKNLLAYKADVVSGYVASIYPESTPKWIIEGDFFGRDLPETGTSLDVAYTCNSLLIRSSLPEGFLFDTRYNQTGGEDTDLFYRMTLSGKKIIACKEAVVSETVEEHRLNKAFLLKKALRVGETYQLIILNRLPLITRFLYLGKNLIQWFIASILSLFLKPINAISSVKFAIKANSNKGKVMAFFKGDATKLYTENSKGNI